MATNWERDWDDEEWLKRQNAVTLHSIFREAQAQGKDTAVIKKVVVNQLHSITDFKQTSSYDLLSYLKVADETDLTVTGNNGQTRNLKEEIKAVVTAREKTLENNDDLISRLNRKALLEAAKIVGTADEASNIQNAIDAQVKPELEDKLQKSTGSDEEFDQFDMAERSGALDDISDSAKNAFIDKLAEMSKWDSVEGQLVVKNDNALLNAVSSLDVYKQDGSLNDVYSDCAELADKIQFEYPEGSTDAQKAELAKAYKQQLLANAAQRATNEVLKDRSLLMRYKTADEILNAYKAEVYHQFERGVVIAGLTTGNAAGILLDNVKRNRNTGEITYGDDTDDATKQAIDNILSGNAAINPLTVQMDTYQLDVETRKIENILKRKKVDTKKLGFWTKAKNGVKAAYENIAKKGGWRKLVLNGAIFGTSAALMAVSGSAVAIGIGAGLYAGWTTVNAWLTPVYDKLNNEMYGQKVKGLKARLAYLKQNWSRVRREKHQEPGFKSRAWWRTVEGAVIGGLTGGMGFLGITGWTKVFSRQGAMTAGKGGSFIRSLFKRKSAQKALDANYSMANYNALQTAEGYLKQDAIALGAVIGGALIGDGIKAYAEHAAVAESLGSVDNETQISDETSTTEEAGTDAGNDKSEEVAADANSEKVVVDEDNGNSEEAAADANSEKVVTDTDNGNSGETYNGHELNANGPYNLKDIDFKDYTYLKPYDKEAMGISFRSYNTLIQVYGAKELDRMLQSLNREGVMDNFNGLTKEQLLVRFRGLDATTDRVGKDGFSIQGAKRWHHEEAMTYLNKLFGPCGDQITPEQYAVINKSLAVMDNQGGYHGEGIVPTSSVHIRAHGYNTPDCGQGELNQFRLGGRINANPQPVHTEPMVVPEQPTQPEPQITPVDYTVSEGDVNGFVNTATAPEPTQFNVNFRDPFPRATAAYANGSQDYPVEGSIPDGAQVIKLDSRGHLHLWQKGTVVEGGEVVSGQNGVEAMHSTALNLNMNNLGSARITDDAKILSFQYGQGKHALTFVLDKNSGEMRTFLGNLKAKNEIVLDQETAGRAAIVLNKTMHESGLDGTYKLNFGSETEQNNEHLSRYLDANEKAKVEQGINRDISKAVKKGADEGMKTTQFEQPETVPVYTPARLTSEQQAALLSDNARIMSNGQVEGGQMIFEVKGVDGVERLAMPAVRSVSIADGRTATVEISTDVHQHSVRIPGADGQEYTVQINSRGGAAQVLGADGHKVYLDETSAKAFGAATKQALEANGVKGVGNIDLNPYPKGSLGAKCVAAYNGYVQQRNLAQAVQSTIGRK